MTGRQNERPAAPPGLWERPEMADALAERDMGRVVRIFRKWTGASQSDVSVLVGIPQPHISDLERGGRHITALALFERFADGLGIPRGLLGLGEPAEDVDATDRVAASQRDWLNTRQVLKANRSVLTHAAHQLYDESDRLARTGIIMPPAWRLDRPIDIGDVELTWQEDVPTPTVDGKQGESRPERPLATLDRLFPTYHRAMRDLDRPRLFENRLCYRLLDVQVTNTAESVSLNLTNGNMCYFDMIDVGETLAHETALAAMTGGGEVDSTRVTWPALPFRRLIGDPFDLATYPLMLSVSTLTIRRSRAGSTFYLLRRNPAKVAIAGGMRSVFPTGVFQPASVIPAPASPDYDLWRNVMREYSEEFLGNPEHDGDGPPIDYDNTEPFRSLNAARAAGRLKVYVLGVGIDALNYVSDVFTAAIFDADVFDNLFDGMVTENDEGDVDTEQFALDDQIIDSLLLEGALAPSGAACLALMQSCCIGL